MTRADWAASEALGLAAWLAAGLVLAVAPVLAVGLVLAAGLVLVPAAGVLLATAVVAGADDDWDVTAGAAGAASAIAAE